MESQEEPTSVCDNCGKSIPESKAFLHEAYCFRNIIRCSKCNEPIHKNEVDAHENEVHRLRACRFCKKDFEVPALANHLENCPQKPKMCMFCNCEISSEEFDDHAYQCGSRTRRCTYCDKNIIIRELEDHEAICAVEQFSRETVDPKIAAEDSKEELLEGINSRPKHKQNAPENRLIYKKNLEALKRETQKKKLTKLADRKPVPEGKTQEEVDEELARELNEEYYEGGKQKGRGRLQIDDDDDDYENDFIEEKPRETRETTRKELQSKQLAKKGSESRQPSRAQTLTESRTNVEKQLDEEFFGLKKNTRSTRMEIERESEGIKTRGAQAQVEKKPQRGGRLRRNDQPVSYFTQEVEEEEEAEYYPEEQNETEIHQDPELAQFLSEDAELQRAIQASLEQQCL